MTQKTISLSEDVYNLLKNEKREGESFSDVIERLITKKDNPWLSMQNKFDPELWGNLKRNIKRIRNQNLTGDNLTNENH
ncbi:MAG: antitoxin [Candidatus Lokiarchaeota archaeon]|nr:antitoxin [Candidatus Lokiarchaeota archaeon]MBD3198538.1 antitoxin [Candidatus Lokiarchaeota archaeon]